MSTSHDAGVIIHNDALGLPLPVSANSRQRRASKSKKNKAKSSERAENTTLVFGTVTTLEKFLELLEIVKKEFPAEATEPPTGVRSHYFRAHQNCGFIYFHDEISATQIKASFQGYNFDGQTVRVCPPLEYFENEQDALPIPANSARRKSAETLSVPVPNPTVRRASADPLSIQTPATLAVKSQPRRASHASVWGSGASEPACTLVMKNLNFNVKQEKLLELLGQLGVTPQSVNYHYDQNGTFRGIAFAKYKRVDDAARAMEKLSGLEIAGRTLRVEYKRRASLGPTQFDPRTIHAARLGSIASTTSFVDTFGGEVFDPANMDSEQLDIFTQLSRFKEDHSRNEVDFATSMTMSQRNNVHMVAEFLNLNHVTAGTADSRHVRVTKQPAHAPVDLAVPVPFRQRYMSVDAAFQLQAPHHNRHRVNFNASPVVRHNAKDTFAQPKGPDGTRGFGGRGRGRRDSNPGALHGSGPEYQPSVSMASYRVDMRNSPPQTMPALTSLAPPSHQHVRSASVPVVIMRDGVEFS